MTVPVVVLPNPWKAMLELLRASSALPDELHGVTPTDAERICATLPDDFPEYLPYLHVVQVPGGRRNVPLRLATALFDLHLYHVDLFTAMDQARYVAAVVQSFEQRTTAECGFTVVRLVDEPFPLQDPDTGAERAVIPITATYRPV